MSRLLKRRRRLALDLKGELVHSAPPSPQTADPFTTMRNHSDPSLLSHSVVLPLPDEAQAYYYGIPTQPLLLARSSAQTAPWALIEGHFTRPPRRRLQTVRDQALIDLWAKIESEATRRVQLHCPAWQSIDVIHIKGDDHSTDAIWIGVDQSAHNGFHSVATIRALRELVGQAAPTLDVQLYAARVQASASGWLDAEPEDMLCDVMPLVGLEIVCGAKRGTSGAFLSCGERTYLTTARHVVSAGEAVSVLSTTTAERSLEILKRASINAQSYVSELKKRERVFPGRLHQAEGAAEAAATRLQLYEDMIKKKPPGSRTVGIARVAPPIEYSHFSMEFALVEITDSTMIPFSNQLYLGESAYHEDLMPDPLPHMAMLRVAGFVPIEELKASHCGDAGELRVYKRGSTTGVTVGAVNSIETVRRVGSVRACKEVCIVTKHEDKPFSAGGDSGALVVDGRGRMVGVLTGGMDATATNDVTWVTPWEWLLPQMEAAVGQTLTLL